jgi:hypothetical protein
VRRIVGALLLVVSVTVGVSSRSTLASSAWPSCTSAGQVECVESLSYTTAAGTFTVANPAGGGALTAIPAAPEPYVWVTGATPSNPMSMVNFMVNPGSNASVAPNVLAGLTEGTYSFVIRLGNYDPTQTILSAEPVSVETSQRSDGTFLLAVTARPKPKVSAGPTTAAGCRSGGWTCQGESATVRNISGAVFQNVIPANRPLFRGMWMATNASEFSSPIISVIEKKVSANIAGPHTVPTGFPTENLVMEDGKGVSPAFYKFYLPYSILEAMLSLAPAEIRSQITPEQVKAKITEAATQKDQPVTLVTSDKGMTIDLGITHFSAPNPEVYFSPPPATTAQSKSSTPVTTVKKYLPGSKYLPSSLVKVPAGYKVSKFVVATSSRLVCATSGTRVLMKKAGTCSVSVTTTKGKLRKVLTARIKVS